MRIFVIAFAVIAATSAASISSDYLPPVGDNSLAPSQEYLAPVGSKPETSVSDDGYRDVSDVVNKEYYKEYLPPNEGSPPAASEEVLEDVAAEAPLEAPQEEAYSAVAVETPEEKTVLADDGYHYKTVRRIRYRHRRDVNELPINEYLPPKQESSAEAVAVETPIEAPQEEPSEAVAVEAPEEKTVLADDGYRYKTVRRIRYRHRRDVNELPANEYLPPNQETSEGAADVIAVEAYIEVPQEEASEAVTVETPEEKTVLADDGYRYKTIRRIRYRHRRDVNELPANEYLPPNQELSAVSEEAVSVEAPIEAPQEETSETVAVEAPEEKTVLADDGYRYKTVRRIRYRHRRDVNELPANEYLPPNQETSAESEEDSSEAVAVETPEEKTILADDGYHYKTVRRIRYRHRRDVNELPANDYLPPNQNLSVISEEAVAVEVPLEAPHEDASKSVAVEAPEENTVLADDGYRYTTIRRIIYRLRRDVNEVPANEYLPPNKESSASSEEDVAVEAPIESSGEETSEAVDAPGGKTVLADDGYRYKVVRRIRYRHRRDVNELPANEYLPPNQELSIASEEAVAVEEHTETPQKEASETVVVEAPEEKTILADDGYHYKTIRRIRYRRH